MAKSDTFNALAVKDALERVVHANGSAYVTVIKPLHLTTNAALVGLLDAFGFDTAKASLPYTDTDLFALYSVTRKNLSAGYSVAEKPAKKSGTPPKASAFDPFASVPLTPMPPPSAKPSEPSAAPSLSESDMHRVAKRVVGEALEPIAQALQVTIDDYATGTNKRIESVSAAIDARVTQAVESALKQLAPVTLSVTTPEGSTANLGLAHRKTPDVINALSAGVNVYLIGPAGSGKTTIGQQCSKAFDLPFYFAAKVESEYLLLGFKDANGNTVRTQFRDAYEHGGVFLFDELDGSSAGAVVALNAALANGYCPFPDGTIARHADFHCIAAGNTGLIGANRQYVGRQQLDAASVDRFAFIDLPYDEALERQLASDAGWCDYVQRVRKAVAERGLNHLVTPRATYDGCKLLASGFTWDDVADMCIFKALDRDTVNAIKSSVGIL